MKLTIQKIEYDITHMDDGTVAKTGGKRMGEYFEEEEPIPGLDAGEAKRRFVSKVALRVKNINRSAEERCKFQKSSKLTLLIITNV